MPLEYALQFRGLNPDPGPWKFPRTIQLRPTAALGIADFPNQQAKRSKHRNYFFNIMVAGESGLGKTTFLNTLFNAPLTEVVGPENLSSSKTVQIQPQKYELVEEGVTLSLTAIDTPGFGDQLNREQNFLPIIEYIEKQYDDYLAAERAPKVRGIIPDHRVHCLLYFLKPTGLNRIADLDLEFLQRICTKVNVIPVIAKADSLAPEELGLFKKAILRDFAQYDIRAYPTFHAEDTENLSKLEQHIPFSVIGSDRLVNASGKMVRGRQYRWGVVEVENPLHCDFIYLRELLISTNMQDMIDTTHSIHYASYRGIKIRGKGRPESFLACDDMYESNVEDVKRSLQDEMQKKEEAMRQRFVAKVREKEQELREREEALNGTRQRMLEELEALRKTVEAEEVSYNEIVASKRK